MRKALQSFILVAMSLLFINAFGVSKQHALTWAGATTAEVSVLDADTSAVFNASEMFKLGGVRQMRSPETNNWIMHATGVGAGDSVNVTFYVDWSNDQVTWQIDTIGAIPDVVTAAGTKVTLSLKMTDNPMALYGRVRAVVTGADTVTVGGSVNKVYTE